MRHRPVQLTVIAVIAALSVPIFAAPPAALAAKKRTKKAPLKVAENPLELARGNWVRESGERGATAAKPSNGLRIAAIYPAPVGAKNPQPAEAIQLVNLGAEPVPLAGVRIEVRWRPRKNERTAAMDLRCSEILEPGATIWL